MQIASQVLCVEGEVEEEEVGVLFLHCFCSSGGAQEVNVNYGLFNIQCAGVIINSPSNVYQNPMMVHNATKQGRGRRSTRDEEEGASSQPQVHVF